MRPVAAGCLCIVLAAAGWRLAEACAPDFRRAVFSYVRHPDLPRTDFIDGRLGVLQPTFARSYLVLAYRHLNGTGLNAREREQARDFYMDRETADWDRIGTDWPARWRSARERIRSPRPPATPLVTSGQLAYDPETHSFALNCADDAFRVALHTLEARRSQFGERSAAFRFWLQAQDAVFSNCIGGPVRLPEEAPAGLPALILADREYQTAASYFYAARYDAALDRFHRIGQTASSPWNSISRYLVVRTLLRLTDDSGAAVQAGARFGVEADAILADSKLASIHGMTWNLVERAGIRQRDPHYFHELGRLLSSRGQDNGLREELWNYTGMYDHMIGEADPNSLFPPPQSVAADPAPFRDIDLSDWIFSFQSRDASAFAHSVERWRQTRSVAWLLAALAHANASAARGAALLDAAAAIPETSPGYLTARFHLLRLLLENSEKASVRNGLDQLLGGSSLARLPSSTNLFRCLRMLSAPDLAEFVRFATRKPLLVTSQMNVGESPAFFAEAENRAPLPGALFDADATRVLNGRTPFRLLKQVALGEYLPANLRAEALLTAFTRGLMLDEPLSDLAAELATAIPELAPYTAGYLKEPDDGGRRFAAAYLLLHRPEARPYFTAGISRQSRPGRLDPYRDNWWCPTDVGVTLEDSPANRWYAGTPNLLQRSTASLTPAFLTSELTGEAESEMERLDKLHAATDFLGGIVLRFAEGHREDERVPEALYWLVRAGHYGCMDVDTWKTTRDAFRLLQRRYPKTTWAKRTPTWFKNDYDIHTEIKQRQPY